MYKKNATRPLSKLLWAFLLYMFIIFLSATKRLWREIVEKDCRARGLNMEDDMCRSRWRKQIGMIDDHNECSG